MPHSISLDFSPPGWTWDEEGVISLHHGFFPPFSVGTWRILYSGNERHRSSKDPQPTARLTWEGCTERANLVKGSVFVSGYGTLQLPPGVFPIIPQGELRFPSSYGGGGILTVSVSLEVGEVPSNELAQSARFDRPPDLPVCLEFSGGNKLWVASNLLSEFSPFWKTRLSATDFADTSSSLEADESDANDEIDKLINPVDLKHIKQSDYRTLSIAGSSIASCRALLAFTQGVKPTFSALTSSYRTPPGKPSCSAEEARDARLDQLKEYHSTFPSHPLLVSSKSLYRLAHFLEIPSLQQVALEGLKARLSPLFSPLAQLYKDVAQVELEYAQEHLEEMRTSKGLEAVVKEMEERGLVGEEKGKLLAFKLVKGK